MNEFDRRIEAAVTYLFAGQSVEAENEMQSIAPDFRERSEVLLIGHDNAGMESFWATLKTELIDGQVYATRAEAKSAIFSYIEIFYNRTRLHSALGFYSPVNFEHNLN